MLLLESILYIVHISRKKVELVVHRKKYEEKNGEVPGYFAVYIFPRSFPLNYLISHKNELPREKSC